MNAREFLEDMLKKEEIYFGEKSQEYYNSLVNIWMDDHNDAKHLFDIIKLYLPNATKILDMGSGCGTCVFYSLIHGYDMYGIDPSLWKFKFNRMKAKEYSYPSLNGLIDLSSDTAKTSRLKIIFLIAFRHFKHWNTFKTLI